MTAEELYALLKPTQEKKGFYFNPDHDWTLDVLNGILTNKERYGYGSCPCRLATGQRERDREIVCPCAFREEDTARYGRCYCLLYCDQAAAEGRKKVPEVIPERWLRA
ncbi:MAG: ferredoxin:thioredoxin reductase [Candidatus Adiutrix sp.]|jgi:ferredoxin-thioredoxin reductase catalytic subunit|nr:ferredoxin:thioredoxin reductase [Candidatus Adiutrix sp.]